LMHRMGNGDKHCIIKAALHRLKVHRKVHTKRLVAKARSKGGIGGHSKSFTAKSIDSYARLIKMSLCGYIVTH
jgi:hypothetical protein